MTKKLHKKTLFERSEYEKAFTRGYKRKSYEKPILQSLDISADMIAGASTSNQLENSGGLIGS